jgi:hypothetical protein
MQTLKRGLQVNAVMASWYVLEGPLKVIAENWWQLLEKVAIIVIVGLLKYVATSLTT